MDFFCPKIPDHTNLPLTLASNRNIKLNIPYFLYLLFHYLINGTHINLDNLYWDNFNINPAVQTFWDARAKRFIYQRIFYRQIHFKKSNSILLSPKLLYSQYA